MKGLYQILLEEDLIAPVADLLRKGRLVMEPDGTVKASSVVVPDRAWVFSRMCLQRQCEKWFEIYYKRYNILSRGCRKCKKIVLEIDSLHDLVKVKELQRRMNKPSKCGIEKRAFTGNLGKYYAFWYCKLEASWNEARAYWEEVRKRVGEIGIKPKVILKKGCSEMERDFYPSSSWRKRAREGNWDKKQDQLDRIFVDAKLVERELEILARHNMKMWIEYAFEHGDKTYLEFTSHPFKLSVETYHEE